MGVITFKYDKNKDGLYYILTEALGFMKIDSYVISLNNSIFEKNDKSKLKLLYGII